MVKNHILCILVQFHVMCKMWVELTLLAAPRISRPLEEVTRCNIPRSYDPLQVHCSMSGRGRYGHWSAPFLPFVTSEFVEEPLALLNCVESMV